MSTPSTSTAAAQSLLSCHEEPSPSILPPKSKRHARPLRLLHLPSSNSFVPHSPLTPSSVFSFELSDSPGLLPSSGRRARHRLTPHTPSSVFSFDFFPDLQPIKEATPPTTDDESENGSSRRSSAATAERVTDWKCIRLVAFILFLVRIQFTVYFASLWPMLQEMDSAATPAFLSLMNALYSVGVGASAPLFGWLASKYGFRRPALASLFLMLLTNIAYIWLDQMPSPRRFYLLLIRFFVGIAAGGSSTLNTHWSSVAAAADRAAAASLSDAAFSLGIAFGPLFQLCFSLLGYPGVAFYCLRLNMYTLPAALAVLFVLFAIFLLLRFFHEEEYDPAKTKESEGDSVCTETSEEEKLDRLAISLCIFLKIVQMFFYANIETIGSMFLEWMFSLSRQETTQLASALVSLSGLVGFLFLVCYVWSGTAKKSDNRLGVVVGVLFCVFFLLATFPWPWYSKTISSSSCSFSWCSSTARISLPLYAVSYILLFSIGFPLMNVHAAALLSSLVGSRRQAVWHGASTLAATLSRVSGPLVTTRLLSTSGPSPVWLSQLSILSFLLLLLLCAYNRLGIRVHPSAFFSHIARRFSIKQ